MNYLGVTGGHQRSRDVTSGPVGHFLEDSRFRYFWNSANFQNEADQTFHFEIRSGAPGAYSCPNLAPDRNQLRRKNRSVGRLPVNGGTGLTATDINKPFPNLNII